MPGLRCARRSAPAGGWGFGYFVAGLWWLGSAFLVDADQFAWALPFGVLGLPAALALFPALGFALARLIWRADAARVLALAVGLGFSEWLRCVVLTGFPWNEFGMALGGDLDAGADRLVHRSAWPDPAGDRDLRRAGDVGNREAAALAADGARRAGARRDLRLRRLAA